MEHIKKRVTFLTTLLWVTVRDRTQKKKKTRYAITEGYGKRN